VDGILEFYIDANCVLSVAPRDAISTTVRLEWKLKDFFAQGGTTTFVDRLCGSLGIHASSVKVVRVYEGSVGVDYEILPSEDEPMSLEQIAARQTEQFATGAIDLGAPVLDVTQGATAVVADGVAVAPGFSRTVLVRTPTNGADVVWKDWLEPFCWSMFQSAVIDAPVLAVYEFYALGLKWLHHALASEIIDMAIADMKRA